ncbi:MAG: PTS sugar transporter subunit IIA [Spirochaetaceae bacterium]|nr:PTS sugar transporter subunit IIA [Spirochaetaceae bacterium]
MDSVLTLNEVAKYLKLSEKTLQKMVKNKEIPCAKIANQWRFSRIMVDDWLRSKMEVIPKNDLSKLIEKEFDYVPLSRLMDENAMIMDLKSNDKYGVLTELAEISFNNKLIHDKEYLISKLLEREDLTSTSIGNGIALPHLRKPSNDVINEPKIVIGISNKGIDYNSFDGSPTHIFFLILSDSEVVHLRILSKIARVLRNKESLDKIKSFTKKEEFLKFFIDVEKENFKAEVLSL